MWIADMAGRLQKQQTAPRGEKPRTLETTCCCLRSQVIQGYPRNTEEAEEDGATIITEAQGGRQMGILRSAGTQWTIDYKGYYNRKPVLQTHQAFSGADRQLGLVWK